jgi:hypothetical protein
MAIAAADLYGVVAYPDVFSLDRAIELGEKATGVGSAVPIGRVVAITEATGVWATATSGNDTRLGVIPKLYPGKDVNTDSSAKITVLTGPNAEVYCEADAAIVVGQRVVAANGGRVKAWTSGNWFGVYMGHYGEGSGQDNAATDAVANDAVRIKINTR